MKTYNLKDLLRADVCRICERNPLYDRALIQLCEEIFAAVEARGDEALREYTQKFDGVELSDFRVPAEELARAADACSPALLAAMESAAKNIRKFHAAQQTTERPVEVQQGVVCWRASRAIVSVGLYVPGGTAVLPSTVLMLGVPARLAGSSKVVMCVPPGKNGQVAPAVLAAAHVAGIRQLFKVGGAQAVAAMALGTASIPRVNKILGPGNRYVQTAKLLATFRGVAIDMIAGPSEVLVIADHEADPRVVAADLIAQAEHGSDSQSVLVSTSEILVQQVLEEVDKQLADLPRRELAEAALEQSFAVVAGSMEEAFGFSNQYAPEHLILQLADARDWLGRIQSAGSVFVGPWTPEVAGDYASGTNHTLPTSGLARAFSGVSLDSFNKLVTFQEISSEGLSELAPVLEALADAESLEGHRRAVAVRLDKQESSGD